VTVVLKKWDWRGFSPSSVNNYLPFSFGRTRTAWYNDASNISSIVACIHCSRKLFTEPLPSNDRIYIQKHRLIGRIYEVCR
jgi:hypothetical protein